jgi:hypothetical protein
MNPFPTLDDHPYPVGPEAVPPAPRRIELTLWTRIQRVALLATLLLAPNVALVIGFLSGADVRALKASGVQTTGKVECLWETRSSRNVSTYHASYQITVSGKTYLQETTITKAESDRLREGSSCVVTYLPADPRTSCLGSPSQQLNQRIDLTLFLAGLVVVLAGVGLTCVEISVRREIRLATHGLATVGLIIDNGMQRTRNGHVYWARYEFSSPVDEHARSWNWVPLFIWEQIPRGTTVTILYDPDRPSRHMPLYAFKHLRLLPVKTAKADSPTQPVASGPRSTGIAQLPHRRVEVASRPPVWHER